MNVILVRSRASDPNVLKIARFLANNDFKTSVLIWDRTGKNKDTIVNKMRIRFFRIHAPYDKVTIVFYQPFWWLFEFVFLLSNANRDTVIHVCDLDTLWPAIFVKILKRVQLNYTIYDFYADNLPNKTPRIIRALIAFIEKSGLRFAHTVFLVDESRLAQVNGGKLNNVVYIYNTPEDSYAQNFNLSQNTKKTTEFSIFYAGTLIEDRGILNLIKTIEEIDNIKLIIAGIGPLTNYLKNISVSQKGKMQYLSWLSYNEVIGYTRNADLLFALYNPNVPNNRFASPNKLFEAMMCGKPIIVSDGGSMADIVRRETCGLVIPYGDNNALKNAILTLRDNPNLRKQLGANGRKAYENKYSWMIMEGRLILAYEELL